MALLWLHRGQVEAAAAAVRRALEETLTSDAARADLLAAHIEVLLAMGDTVGARSAAAELQSLAAKVDGLALRALADRADGSVLLAEQQPGAAATALQRSWRAWQQLEAPYEAARVRVLIARACEALGDTPSAALELDGARWAFERLGAAFDFALLDRGSEPTARSSVGGLTSREIEVLGLIAAGETNKGIAAALVISEHTVARHVQNMLQKLGCASRASLAAFAVEQGMARRPIGQK
jgi:ATP/maltotriose-dependent transcriptional regulator MalT